MTCPITMEQIEYPKELECKHVFETHAIEQWLIDNNTCPVCRFQVYEKKDITQQYDNIPEFIVPEAPNSVNYANISALITSLSLRFNGRHLMTVPIEELMRSTLEMLNVTEEEFIERHEHEQSQN